MTGLMPEGVTELPKPLIGPVCRFKTWIVIHAVCVTVCLFSYTFFKSLFPRLLVLIQVYDMTSFCT